MFRDIVICLDWSETKSFMFYVQGHSYSTEQENIKKRRKEDPKADFIAFIDWRVTPFTVWKWLFYFFLL